MHPIFEAGKNLAVASGLWLVLSVLMTLFFQSQAVMAITRVEAINLFLPWVFFYFFFCLSNYYVCIRFPIRSANFVPALVVQISAAISTIFLWFLLGFVWANFLHKLGEPNWLPLLRKQSASIGIVAAMLYCFWMLAHYVYLMAKQHELIARDVLEKKLLLSEIELQSIKATTHPHFLYNALNTVASLSLSAPNKVHNLCLQISEFLRYSVSYTKKNKVTVNDEIEHIQNYLGIERERFGERLTVIFSIDEALRDEVIIPLVLFPLVENAIKHGIDGLIEGGAITVKLESFDASIHVSVANPYDPLSVKPKSTSLGLSALRSRILAQYGAGASIIVKRENTFFSVLLILPKRGFNA